ncbi:MAG TPA: LysM domain-containing protein [Pyrinomonadaceae bacterium]|jgi:nucleoid-associated protein YgaU|nr:LysM domain-containing protein [Pyrinomonadaceae bacterium]
MSLQEKYQPILELANQNGTTYNLSEADGVLHIDGNAPSEEAKQQLWDKYNEIDPDYKSGDLMLNITVGAGAAAGGGGHTYTVEAGDNLTKIGQKYGLTWQQVYDANRDIISDPDMIHPGQELKIPI